MTLTTHGRTGNETNKSKDTEKSGSRPIIVIPLVLSFQPLSTPSSSLPEG